MTGRGKRCRNNAITSNTEKPTLFLIKEIAQRDFIRKIYYPVAIKT